MNTLLGFNEEAKDIKHNSGQVDALPNAKDGTLQQKLDELFNCSDNRDILNWTFNPGVNKRIG